MVEEGEEDRRRSLARSVWLGVGAPLSRRSRGWPSRTGSRGDVELDHAAADLLCLSRCALQPIASSLPSNPSLPAKPLIGMPHQSNAPVASGSGSGGAGGSIMSALYLGDMYWVSWAPNLSSPCAAPGSRAQADSLPSPRHPCSGRRTSTSVRFASSWVRPSN